MKDYLGSHLPPSQKPVWEEKCGFFGEQGTSLPRAGTLRQSSARERNLTLVGPYRVLRTYRPLAGSVLPTHHTNGVATITLLYVSEMGAHEVTCPRAPNAKWQTQDKNTDLGTSKSTPHLISQLPREVDTTPCSLCTNGLPAAMENSFTPAQSSNLASLGTCQMHPQEA